MSREEKYDSINKTGKLAPMNPEVVEDTPRKSAQVQGNCNGYTRNDNQPQKASIVLEHKDR
jgi:hypothetical protein